jgi:ribosomal protein L11 methylase PrmA
MLTQDNHLYLCPAGKDKDKPLKRVLDAGCGTGIWAIDMGMPTSRVQVGHVR